MDNHARYRRALMLEERLNELSVRAQEADFSGIEYYITLAMEKASLEAERLSPRNGKIGMGQNNRAIPAVEGSATPTA